MAESNIHELITAYADEELLDEEKKQLLAEAELNPAIRNYIDEEIRLKEFISKRVMREKMPADVRDRVLATVRNEAAKHEQADAHTNSGRVIPGNKVGYMLLAAAVLVAGFFIYWFQPEGEIYQTNTVEFLTFQHYQNHGGILPATLQDVFDTSEAHLMLRDKFGCNVTVPELKGARFAGVLYADFFEGYHTPLLGYEVADGDFIYIFAFELKDLDKYPALVRNSDAVKAIVRHNDVYIVKIEEHDVVSWKWEGVWYSAVSNHDGAVVAAMLPH